MFCKPSQALEGVPSPASSRPPTGQQKQPTWDGPQTCRRRSLNTPLAALLLTVPRREALFLESESVQDDEPPGTLSFPRANLTRAEREQGEEQLNSQGDRGQLSLGNATEAR